jgi:hypothetical protein
MDLTKQLDHTIVMWRRLRHKEGRRSCEHLDHAFGCDWHTCLHPDNPTAINVCSYEHCPIIETRGD